MVDINREEDDGVVREVAAVNTNEPNHVKPATKVGDDYLGITSLDKEGEVSMTNRVPGTPNTDLHNNTVAVDETLTRFGELHLVLTMNPSRVIGIDVENYELLLLGLKQLLLLGLILELKLTSLEAYARLLRIVHEINGVVSTYKSKKKISEVKEVKGFKGYHWLVDSLWVVSLGLGIKVYTSVPAWPLMVIGKFIEAVIMLIILMVDSITFGHEMVNILVSGEEYDKLFNHLDMLNAPFEGKIKVAYVYSPLMDNNIKGNLLSVVAWHGTRIEGFIVLKKYQQVHGDLK
ncbi:hypothetical protein Tco_1184033 [Tanacetum coccineum]